uniref:Synaptogyrin n=1 Tax=Eptatretus burgeri TaxID=7764 RepID=A0A8C4R7K0_EPTBU
MESISSAYGAGKAGGALDPVAVTKQPQTILRALNWVFAVIVFGCISNEGYISYTGSPELTCIFNQNEDACRFGVTIGVIAFFASLCFFLLDIYFAQISSVKDRRNAIILDMAFSGFWAFMWFVAFCFLTDQWRATKEEKAPSYARDSARAAITFCFFSIFSWAASVFLAYKRFRLGVDSTFSESYVDPGQTSQEAPFTKPYPSSGPVEHVDSYQRSDPFPDGMAEGLGYQSQPY